MWIWALLGFRRDFLKIQNSVDVAWVANEIKPCGVKNLSSTEIKWINNFFYSFLNIYIYIYSKLESYLSCDPIHSRIIYMLTLKKKKKKNSSTLFNSILIFQYTHTHTHIYIYIYIYIFSIIESINNRVRIWICLTILH